MRKLFFCILLCVLTQGCGLRVAMPPSSRSSSSAPSRAVAKNNVAILGDSEAQVQAEISAARAKGLYPQYITVSALHRAYIFSVFSTVARSAKTVLIAAYDDLYVFRSADVTIKDAAGFSIDLQTLPLVTAPKFDERASRPESVGHFAYGNRRIKVALCADCIALIRRKPNVSAITQQWGDVKDPWQGSPDFREAKAPVNMVTPAMPGPRIISDGEVDANIDAQVPSNQRSYIRQVMLSLPPNARDRVAGIDPKGHFFANRYEDYVDEAKTPPWKYLGNGLWLNPQGEKVALPP